jgi:DNA polymerase-3 subunit gamma/tau
MFRETGAGLRPGQKRSVSLYRTWRPKTFTELVGQDAVVRTLRTALSSGKLAHAYLFSGPRGSGKTSAAKILARCIDCVHGPTPEPDNSCENCLAILAGTALDVIEVDAASNRGIEEIRALRDSVKFAPASMRMKVFIIDEAHMLTREGANAFLKTLEEPPAHAVFILATTAPEALPPTILSRCQRYAFRRIPVAVMIDRLRTIADAEGIAIDDAALGAIAYRADGGLRDALTMLEQVAAYAGGAVDTATVEAAFGIGGREYARSLVDAILGGDAARALHVVADASDAGADMFGLIRGAIGEYRNLLVARIDPGLLGRDLSPGDADQMIALAAATAQPRVVRGLRLLADALASSRLSGSPRLELETAVLRLVVQTEDPTLEALATRVALLEQGGVVPGAATKVPSAAQPLKVAPPPAAPRAATAAETLTSATPAEAPAGAPVAEAPKGASLTAAAPVAQPPAKPPAARPAIPRENASSDGPPPPAARPAIPREHSAAAASAAPPPGPSLANGGPPTLQQVRSLWDQIRLRADERHKPLKGPLARATVDAVDAESLTIGVTDELQEGIVRNKLAIVEDAVADVVGRRLRIIIRARTPATSAHRAPPQTAPAGATPAAHESAAASASDPGGEVDLLAYARKKLGGTETQ